MACVERLRARVKVKEAEEWKEKKKKKKRQWIRDEITVLASGEVIISTVGGSVQEASVYIEKRGQIKGPQSQAGKDQKMES